jgi:hypothetical protein
MALCAEKKAEVGEAGKGRGAAWREAGGDEERTILSTKTIVHRPELMKYTIIFFVLFH